MNVQSIAGRGGAPRLSDKDLNRWSLIVLRGPRKRVRQFRFGRRWVVVLPTLLLAAFAALIIMLQERAACRIADLERRLVGLAGKLVFPGLDPAPPSDGDALV